MRPIKFAIKQFFKEPLWFKLLISITLLASIIFSSSMFSENPNYQALSKLAAAIFFVAYGVKFRHSRFHSMLFFAAALICIVISISVIGL